MKRNIKKVMILFVFIIFITGNFTNAIIADEENNKDKSKINESFQIEIQKRVNFPDSSLDKTNLKEIPEFLENGISVVQLPNRLNIFKDINQSDITLSNPPVDYFYECNFYPYDGDGDGDDESILAEFDVDTLEVSDYVTVIGGLFDDDDNLIDVNSISYWVYGYEWDYEYLDFTAFWNGTIGWDTYYVLLLLYDSNDELDDWCYSPNISLYVNPYDLFWECNFYPYDEDSDGYNDSILAEFDVDTLQSSDYVTVDGYLLDDGNLIDGPNSISYWVYDMEYDYEYLDFTALWNGTIGWDNYYVLLLLYDSTGELDDYWISSNISLYVSPANWTFMVYLDGDNDLEEVGIDDFLEMSSIGSDSNINIVVQFDRIQGYDSRYDDWSTTKRYYVTQGMVPDEASAIMDLGELNMGDPQTLIDFVNWTINNYSSDYYCLVLWDHGNGWRNRQPPPQKGICWDASSGNDYLNMTELKAAMNTVKSHLGKNTDIVGFDACLMGMLEVYYQLNATVDIAVGSEESVPWDGWPYDDILAALKLNPEMSPSDLSTEIVNEYFDFYGYNNYLTMAAYNVSKLSNTLIPKVDVFSQTLKNNVYTYYPNIYDAREATEFYSYSEYRDLYDFAYEIKHRIDDVLIKTVAQDVMDAINESCISEKHGTYAPDSHGLSIYWEEDEISYNNDYENIDFAIDTQWDEFLISYYTDAFESDDQYTQANWIESDGVKQFHNFHIFGDHDWVKFNATTSFSYVIETSEIGNGSDTYLYLYDIDGTTLIDSDDEGGEGLASRINWTCPISGSYYLMVRHWDNISYGPKTHYKISVIIRLSANFTYNPIHPTTQDIVYFNSTTYSNLVNWTWEFGDGETSYTENTTHQYADDGTYIVILNVTDEYGVTNETSQQIVVSNIAPTADFSWSPINSTTDDIIQFNDTSVDIDGAIVSWLWDFGDGTTSTYRNPIYQYDTPGNYTVELNVTDNDNASSSIVKIVPVTLPPTAVYIDDNFNSSTPGWEHDHFDNIQNGIDAVSENGTVHVFNGTYYENVIVNKTINLIGENITNTIINGSGSGNGVYITADWVNISGFTVTHANGNWSGGGITVNHSSFVTIENCTISDNHEYGIYFYYANQGNIINNIVINNWWGGGIFIEESVHNTISDNVFILNRRANLFILSTSESGYNHSVENNTVNGNPLHYYYDIHDQVKRGLDSSHITIAKSSNITVKESNITSGDGIHFAFVTHSTITDNTIAGNSQTGIFLHYSSNNTLSNNWIHHNSYGIDMCVYNDNNTIYNNSVKDNFGLGIAMSVFGCDNVISYNHVENNSDGIVLTYAVDLNLSNNYRNTVENNTIMLNRRKGIGLWGSAFNIIRNNTILYNSEYGIKLNDSSDNIIYNNHFNNTNNAWDNGNNFWNVTKTNGTNIIGGLHLGGNYWHDYTGEDTDGDGLGDTEVPYNSSGDIEYEGDWLPLVYDTIPPEISDVSAYPTIQEGWGWVNTTCDVTDNVGLNLVEITIVDPNDNSTTVPMTHFAEDTFYHNDTYTQNGTYMYHIQAWDTSRNTNTSPTYHFWLCEIINVTELNEIGEQNVSWMDVNITLNITDPTNITFVEYAQNPYPENQPPNALDRYIDIEVENWETVVNPPINITIYYTEDDLVNASLTEDQLAGIHFWNGTAGEWQLYNDTGVNTTYNQSGYEGYCWAEAWHLTPLTMGGQNQPPNEPGNPSPGNGATNIDINSDLSWDGGDPDPGDMVTYDVYFGRSNSPPKVSSNRSGTSYDPGLLDFDTTYYWQIVAWDNYGASAEGAEWSFTTKGTPSPPPPSPPGGDPPYVPPPLSNQPPIANASAGEPYTGYVGEEITFDGSLSYDPDGEVVSWFWDFGDGFYCCVPGNVTGETATHSYSNPGTYNVTLTVTDNEDAKDTDETTAFITQANRDPSTPEITGPTKGSKNIVYDFNATSVDLDNNSIEYIFDWDDGDTSISDFLPNGTIYTATHSWALAGKYTITVIAYDNKTYSGTAQLTVLIDACYVNEIGYLIDEDTDGVYDVFHNNVTGNETRIELQDNGNYLIDDNGDAIWDYEYNPETSMLTSYPPLKEEDMSPWYVLFALILALVISVIIFVYFVHDVKKDKKQKKKKGEKKREILFKILFLLIFPVSYD